MLRAPYLTCFLTPPKQSAVQQQGVDRPATTSSLLLAQKSVDNHLVYHDTNTHCTDKILTPKPRDSLFYLLP
ncbi:hypothetical protein E2C01_059948 [Portunus trituberculatus]|uniref:Uncharacterized protein n=1 Tax=Portunus trituberculatus TaxID=210409 RepID=A0A5B7H403_PORTR|nr:hypothetical protein [Portunus trituberculatus]